MSRIINKTKYLIVYLMIMARNYILCRVTFVLWIFGLCASQLIMRPVFVNESDLVPRVRDGEPVDLNEVPYYVGFKKLLQRSQLLYITFCGGAIIRRDAVLTASHCFHTYKLEVKKAREFHNVFAVAGSLWKMARYQNNREGPAQWRHLNHVVCQSPIHIPPNADLAVAVVEEPFIFTHLVSPINYARTNYDYSGSCLFPGYEGQTQSKLVKVYLKLLPLFWCNSGRRRRTDKYICTADSKRVTEEADAGGPLVCWDPHHGVTVVGILSEYKRDVGSLFSRVSYYTSFIESSSGAGCFELTVCYWVILALILS